MFNITKDQLHFYAGVSSYNDTIALNIDAYVGGVFVQESYD